MALCSIEIFAAASGLPKMKRFSEADAFAVLYQEGADGGWLEVGRTEIVPNCLNPAWVTQMTVEFHFEDVQNMRVEVFHANSTSPDTRQQAFIGACETTLGALVAGTKLSLTLIGETHAVERGTLRLRCEEMATCKDVVSLRWHGRRIENVDGMFGESDPYYTVSRIAEDGQWVAVCKSEVKKNNHSPTWKEAKVNMQRLCQADEERPLRIEVWDYNKKKPDVLIGAFHTCMRVLRGAVQQEFPIVNEAKAGQAGYTHSGTMQLLQLDVQRRFTMVDYVRGGCEVAITCGFDFSASMAQMHQLQANAANPFEAAITAIAPILADYDADNKYPVFGFGATIQGQLADCFSLVAPGQQVEGLAGILAAYRHAVPQLQFAEPTHVAPLIHQACAEAAQFTGQFPQQYQILFIVTDGMIGDAAAAVDAVVRASTLPLSIVFAAVGHADNEFELLHQLDANDAPLTASTGQQAARDCVHVVPLADLYNNPARFKREVLRAVPEQFMAYFTVARVQPNQPVGASAATPGLPPVVAAANQAFGQLGSDMFANFGR